MMQPPAAIRSNPGVPYGYWTVRAELESLNSNREPDARYVTEEESRELLEGDGERAEARARQAIDADAGDLQAKFLLGAALRRQRRFAAAKEILQPLAHAQPHMGFVWRELGLALIGLSQHTDAAEALLRAVDINCLDSDAWYGLGDALDFPERNASFSDSRLTDGARANRDGRFEEAESGSLRLLEDTPDHPGALKLLAESFLLRNRWADAKLHFEKCVALAPDSISARFRYATMLLVHRYYLRALPHINELVNVCPDNRLYRMMKGVALSRSRQYEAAIAEYEGIIADSSNKPGMWLEYAHLLRIAQKKNARDAFRKAIQILPSFVQAYVALAFIKTLELDETFLEEVHTLLARRDWSYEDCARLHFVMGKALEDMRRYAESFEHYRISNEILCAGRSFGAEATTDFKRHSKRFFKPDFFAARSNFGCVAKDPIFIVSLPRSGSTLVEQILSSHSAIEGLGELPDIGEIVRKLADEATAQGAHYPNLLADFDSDRFRSLGEEYMKLTRRRRRTDRAFFTDKMPANFAHIPFIHLILPNARIIDTRRHPMDCCFSCFKHYFPAGQPLSTSLRDIGRSYAEYVELMAYFDEILPDGRVHRVIYEQLIADPEKEVRRLLDYVGLGFEEQCLRFHENDRLVLTISTDQVRLPLYSTGMNQWRPFDRWLGPLKEELGYVLDIYPQVPNYFREVRGRYSEPLTLGPGGNPFSLVKGFQQLPFTARSQRAVLAP